MDHHCIHGGSEVLVLLLFQAEGDRGRGREEGRERKGRMVGREEREEEGRKGREEERKGRGKGGWEEGRKGRKRGREEERE